MYLQMEMKKNDHLSVAGLEEGILDIIVKNINFISSNRRVAESICMRLKSAGHSFSDDIRPNVQIFQFGITFVLWKNQSVLLDKVLLFPFFGFSVFELLLNFLYQPEGGI